jgi:redox-sensitive bicupin YhaK (pirin superfamily)
VPASFAFVQTSNTTTERDVSKIVESIKTFEGAGFPVERPFPTRAMSQFDPFLMIDHFGPINYAPGEAVGAPWHPHRGFETVSMMLQGEFQHKDSTGNKGLLRAGDVQWMTAGSGIIHDESPSPTFQRTGGVLEGFQIWVNLPAKDKWIDPAYQDVPKEKIPTITQDKLTVRVIAGEAYGTKAIVNTHVPIQFLDVHLLAGGEFRHEIPSDMNAMVFLYRGEGKFGKSQKPAVSGNAVLLDKQGGTTLVATATADLKFLVLAGVPLNEPIARHGPFVMNTQAEIAEAFSDYGKDRLMRVKPKFEIATNRADDFDPNSQDSSIV